MSYILVVADADWADEFSCESFWAGPKKEWDQLIKDYKKGFEQDGEVEVCFGTNESLDYQSFESWNRENIVKKITEEEFKSLRRLFASKNDESFSFGTGSNRFEIVFEDDD